MSLELKPCPFCGGRAGFMSNAVDFQEVWGVSCDGECGAQIDSCAWDKEDAAEIWNQRSDAARQEGARGGEPVAWRISWVFRAPGFECTYPGGGAMLTAERPAMEQQVAHLRTWDRVDTFEVQPLYASPAEPSGWRPIESAPKDGSLFLAYVDDEVRVVSWAKTSHVPMWGFCLVDQGPEDCDLCDPAHWMPLPLPPTSEGGGA